MPAFWEAIDQILNSALFTLIGFQVLLIDFRLGIWELAALAIPVVLIGRAVGVGISYSATAWRERAKAAKVALLTWGGLRGGISIALALQIPNMDSRAPLVSMAYAVVLFTVLVQGLSLGRLADWLFAKRILAQPAEAASSQ